MNSLGIYFGPSVISIVESKGRQPINNIRIPRVAISKGEFSEDKVPEEVKMAPYLKEEFKKNKIENQDITVSLSGRDLIIRNFEMPLLPRQELYGAATFEVKKYIPFKVEDLVSDFQLVTDKASRKNCVLFVGIKKEVLDKYLSIFQQIGMKVKAVEYSAFSSLRLMTLSGIREKDPIAVVNIDLVEEDEINFVVLKDGFPLFSRDISFISDSQRVASPGGPQQGMAIERLKREIRVSLDYYDRTFPLKNIGKVFFVMDRDYRQDLENFIKEIGLEIQFININKCVGRPVSFSSAFVKGYSASLAKVNSAVKIDLLAAKEKSIKKVSAASKPEASPMARRFKEELAIPLICLVVGFIVVMLGRYRLIPLENEVNNIRSMRPVVSSVSPDSSYDDLAATEAVYKNKTKTMEELLKKQVYLTKVLEVIPKALPKEVRLGEFHFVKDEDKTELMLFGTAYLGDSDREIETVNSFLARLKESPVLNQYFKDIGLSSVDYGKVKETNMTNFVISCKSYREKK